MRDTTMMPSLFIYQVPIVRLDGQVTHVYVCPGQWLNWQALDF